jgi:hypothetical protein
LITIYIVKESAACISGGSGSGSGFAFMGGPSLGGGGGGDPRTAQSVKDSFSFVSDEMKSLKK